MADALLTGLLAGQIAAGLTVAVLGVPSAEDQAAIAAVLKATGLLLVISPKARPVIGGAAIRARIDNTAILSHAVDVVLVLPAPHGQGWSLLAEECRRILAPRGQLVALLPSHDAGSFASALRSVPFRTVMEDRAGALVTVRARGP